MHCTNKKKKNGSPPISCCTSQGVPECSKFEVPLECPTQCPCCCNKVTSTPNVCDPCKLDVDGEKELCPMMNIEVRMSQKNIAACRDICRDCNPTSKEEQLQQLSQVVENCCSVPLDELETYHGQRHSMSTAQVVSSQKLNTPSTLPLQKKICDACCSEKAGQVDSKPKPLFTPPPRCEISECPATMAKGQDKAPKGSQQFQKNSKQPPKSFPLPPLVSSTPKRPGSSIASETNQTMIATLPKRMENEKSDKKIKKKKNSKTSIKSNTNNMSETCSCAEDEDTEQGCTCHFPPAFSEYFSCTGKITGTCYCLKK